MHQCNAARPHLAHSCSTVSIAHGNLHHPPAQASAARRALVRRQASVTCASPPRLPLPAPPMHTNAAHLFSRFAEYNTLSSTTQWHPSPPASHMHRVVEIGELVPAPHPPDEVIGGLPLVQMPCAVPRLLKPAMRGIPESSALSKTIFVLVPKVSAT